MSKICVIACGVLAIDIKNTAGQLGIDVKTVFLKGGLHDSPAQLRLELQAAIDKVDEAGDCDRIVIGYGVCGRGTVGIKAGSTPLVIPRVHDCISLFLGSDAEYKRQFSKYPGTYYISAGWFDENVEPASQQEKIRSGPSIKQDLSELEKKHGKAGAEHIREFFGSWKRNYQRAAYIKTGMGEVSGAEQYARDLADKYGWKFEKLEGRTSLIKKMLIATESDDEVLIVSPGNVTVFDAVGSGLGQARPHQARLEKLMRKDRHLFGLASQDAGQSVRYGLGIDAGGTYTDVVLYDFKAGKVLAKAKALTTKWNFTVGIEQALSALDRNRLEKTQLVSVSTTLATNSIVEGYGQKVGLLLMPPYGLFSAGDIDHTPVTAIRGRCDIDGTETEPIDPDQVRAAAKEMIDTHEVKAFAVSGYAANINPSHELEVKHILREETGLGVTCGHELSEMLNFRTRAMTAVLNSRIVPVLERFLEQMETTLRAEGVQAPIVVVKGDGTLMSVEMGKERPVETILSGPAASVAGARELTGLSHAIVVDIGGTTTDTAQVRDGLVQTCSEGSTVGGFKTHVRALDMRTRGLGGDSGVTIREGRLRIGPRRVAPVSWLGAVSQGLDKTFAHLETLADKSCVNTEKMQILTLTGHTEDLTLNPAEAAIVAELSERPMSLAELAVRTGVEFWGHVKFARLVEHNIVQLCGFTPTDAAHLNGSFVRWNVDTAARMAKILAAVTDTDVDHFVENVTSMLVDGLAVELLKKTLDHQVPAELVDSEQVACAVVKNWLGTNTGPLKARFSLNVPVVGIGAPAGLFLPRAVEKFEGKCIIHKHADVANAIGAVTSDIVIARHAKIVPDAEKGFIIEGIPGAKRFTDIDEADKFTCKVLVQQVENLARKAGTGTANIDVLVQDDVVITGLGTELFLGRDITASLTGKPDLAALLKD